jgi:NADH-quinone oxidoreductase subunit C
MNFTAFEDQVHDLTSHFPAEAFVKIVPGIQPYIEITAEALVDIAMYLWQSPTHFMDFLHLISPIDNGPEVGTIEILYHLSSLTSEKSFILKVTIPRDLPSAQIPSVASIWRTADWHEREAFDMFGIQFTQHPDLRRILMPADWPGHPLRKDYQEPEFYHDIQVKY